MGVEGRMIFSGRIARSSEFGAKLPGTPVFGSLLDAPHWDKVGCPLRWQAMIIDIYLYFHMRLVKAGQGAIRINYAGRE
jgi:hypothetical protein